MLDRLSKASQYIQSLKKGSPQVGMVLGSGLGAYIDRIEDATIIPYEDIPHFHRCSVEGHQGRLILGKVKGVSVAVLQGRLHFYEGYPPEDIVFPVRTLATLGIESLFLTNAAGGVNEKYRPGDLVLIKDHINFMGQNPLIGPNISEFGPRFPDMTQTYDLELQEIVMQAAKKNDYQMKQGVYAAVLGPTYETPAEVRMIRTIGADMVGMSTVPEAIAANHFGLKICGISCITNLAAGMGNEKLHHDEIKEQAIKVMEVFSNILTDSIAEIGKKN